MFNKLGIHMDAAGSLICISAVADPLTYHGSTRARNAAEFLRVTEDITSSMASMDFSFVVFHGELDTLCDPDGSRQLFQKSAVRDAGSCRVFDQRNPPIGL